MSKVTITDATDADELEIALFKWRIGVCADEETGEDVIASIKQRGGINPEHAKRAAILFRDVIETTDDWWTLYVACKCGAIENDTGARSVFDEAMSGGFGTELLKAKIAEANGKKARGKYKTLAQLIADMVAEMEATNNGAVIGWAKKFALIPAVKKARRRNEQNTL